MGRAVGIFRFRSSALGIVAESHSSCGWTPWAAVLETLDESAVLETLDESAVLETLDESAVLENLDESAVLENLDESAVLETLDEQQGHRSAPLEESSKRTYVSICPSGK
jgi:hypothetical protein